MQISWDMMLCHWVKWFPMFQGKTVSSSSSIKLRNVPRSFTTSGTTHTATEHHNLEKMNPQLHLCNNLKFLTIYLYKMPDYRNVQHP